MVHTKLPGLAAAIQTANILVYDVETTGVNLRRDSLVGVGAYLPETDACFYLNVGHTTHHDKVPFYPVDQALAILKPFLLDQSKLLIAHNATFDLRFLIKHGLNVKCHVADTMTHAHRLDENLRKKTREPTVHESMRWLGYGLKELTELYFREAPPQLHKLTMGVSNLFADPELVAGYCARDLQNTWRLYIRCQKLIIQNPRLSQLTRIIDDRTNWTLTKMLWEGVLIDVAEAKRHLADYRPAMQNVNDEIRRLLDSSPPLSKKADIIAMLNSVGVPIRYTIKGEVLEEFYVKATGIQKKILALLLARDWMRQRMNMFATPLLEKTRYSDDRLYFERFSSNLVTTRYSSKPTVQNLPKKADKITHGWDTVIPANCFIKHNTRNLFIAKPGHTLVSFDLKAAEPRYLAMCFQHALRTRTKRYCFDSDTLESYRKAKYPALLTKMLALQIHKPSYCPVCKTLLILKPHGTRKLKYCTKCQDFPFVIKWPSYQNDPLWEVFDQGGDPYDDILKIIDPNAAGQPPIWFEANRWRGKLAFLALAFGSSPESLAPQLGWTLRQTQAAIQNLHATYATFGPLQELVFRQLIHHGQVQTLWGRPRRINGYFQLAGLEPLNVRFYRHKPTPRYYNARIIPLGSYRQGVQCFVEHCGIEYPNNRERVVLQGDMQGNVIMADRNDPFVGAVHFNNLPFRNISFGSIQTVEDENHLIRKLPRQQRALRQAFNSLTQSTGADHLRWLMNRLDAKLTKYKMTDCKLILTMHDSLIYEVPESRADTFVKMAKPVLETRPHWATIDFPVDAKVGKRFGEIS